VNIALISLILITILAAEIILGRGAKGSVMA
jgi:hypothetical protein